MSAWNLGDVARVRMNEEQARVSSKRRGVQSMDEAAKRAHVSRIAAAIAAIRTREAA